MASGIRRLTDLEIKRAKPGKHADGGGLYLMVSASGAKRWAFLWMAGGKRREMGLGSATELSTPDARAAAARWAAVVKAGGDPIEAREAEARAKAREQAEAETFGSFAIRWFEASVAPGLSNAKHRDQWRMTLTSYCGPIRDKALRDIETADVLAVLTPIWQEKPETAQRLRGRIERVLDAATATGARGPFANPARWRGHLSVLLSRPRKLTRGHHSAMDWRQVPAFMRALRERDALAARALEFIILTAARAGEVLGARWSEIDLADGIWTVPADRMKARKMHRVPLSPQALGVLAHIRPLTGGEPSALVFPSLSRKGAGGPSQPLSAASLDNLRERMGIEGVTTHGFRSAFREWAGDATNAPREIAEACLAHVVGSATERAYRRGDALAKRRELLEAWATFCDGAGGADVVRLADRRA